MKPGRAPVSGGKEAVCGVDVLEKSKRDVGPDVQKDGKIGHGERRGRRVTGSHGRLDGGIGEDPSGVAEDRPADIEGSGDHGAGPEAGPEAGPGMTEHGGGVPEKIDWLEEESDGEGNEEQEAVREAEEAKQGEGSGGADPVQGSEPGILPLSGRNPGGASAAPPVPERSPGVVPAALVVTPVYESFAAQVKRYAQRIKDEYPETDPGRADEQATMLVKNERRQKALEAEGAARAEAPDYDTGSQEVRRGRRR